MTESNKKPAFKNPLLSSNFAVEDFTHNAMILTPAPPVRKEESTPAIFSIDNRSTLPQNIDSFSEVSLERKPETIDAKLESYNPLEDLDTPAQLSLQDQVEESSGLDPQSLKAGLTSSFAQLPNVASTVFSTFSRVIKGSSPVPAEVPSQDHQFLQPNQSSNIREINNQDKSNIHQHLIGESPINQPFELSQEETPQNIPVFYSPNELNIQPVNNKSATSSNTFRLGSTKKKHYAHIPGLNTSAVTPIVTPNVLKPIETTPVVPSKPFEPEVSSAGYFDLTAPQPYIGTQESSERIDSTQGTENSKFSFGGLLPVASQLLQKIPSVHDFAQNFTQPSKSSIEPEPTNLFGIQTDSSTSNTLDRQENSALSFNPNNFNTQQFPPSVSQEASGIKGDATKNEIYASSDLFALSEPQNISDRPPPTFFSADQIPSVPKQTINKSRNPYSNSRFGKTAIYKNPSLIPSTGHTPIILGSEPVAQPLPVNFFTPAAENQAPYNTSPPAVAQQGSTSTELLQNNFSSFPIETVSTEVLENQNIRQNTVDNSEFPKPPTSRNKTESSFIDPIQQNNNINNSFPPVISPAAFFNPFSQGIEKNISNNQSTESPAVKPNTPFDYSVHTASEETDSITKNQLLEDYQQVDLPTNYPPPPESVSQCDHQADFLQRTNNINSSIENLEPVSSSKTLEGHEEESNRRNSNVTSVSDFFTNSSLNVGLSNLKVAEKQEPVANLVFDNTDITPPVKEQNIETSLVKDNQNNNIGQNLFVASDQRSDLPRFTPVHFFNTNSSTTSISDSDKKNNNSAIEFFNNPTTENQFSKFFDQTPAGDLPDTTIKDQSLEKLTNNNPTRFFNQPEIVAQEKLYNQEAFSVNAPQTSSFSSFRSESVSELNQDFTDYDELPEEMADEIDNGTLNLSATDVKYRPVYYHWFYQTQNDATKAQWAPFSMKDSMALEEALNNSSAIEGHLVPTDGSRFDVNISERKRFPVYWKGEPNEVRRCSWFYKALDSRFVPYEEETAEKLEEEYRQATNSGEWHKKIPLANGETVVFHGPSVIVHFLQSQNPDSWGSTAQPTNRPRVVKRGIDEFVIEDGEPEQIDHLLFMVHGIGKACDLKFRTIEEAVDEYRSIALQLTQSHYRTSCDLGIVGRVEVLPVSWHTELHSEEFGIDEKLKLITLESIPKLRGFANETLLDILFYSSPVFCQHIMDIVGNTLNSLVSIFKKRNPQFNGGISLGGHSLGSLILFDLLCHQKERRDQEMENLENPGDDCIVVNKIPGHPNFERRTSQTINYTVGMAGTGQPFINYPQLSFKIKSFFALGSPISMFVTVRGIDKLGLDFKLPTCDGFFNIFHPYDPVAYRCEPLVNCSLSNVRPVLIPHHKGRKRMHLELKETMVRVGADIKQRILFTFKNTMQAVFSLTTKQVTDQQTIEQEVDKALEEQLHHESDIQRTRSDSISTNAGSETYDSGETDLPLGQLNQSRRIDFVLQEAPLEFFNEYLFALTSHVCYWESEDTILFMMKEIYTSMGIKTDSQIPQHSLTIERPSTSSPPTMMSSSNVGSLDKCADP